MFLFTIHGYLELGNILCFFPIPIPHQGKYEILMGVSYSQQSSMLS